MNLIILGDISVDSTVPAMMSPFAAKLAKMHGDEQMKRYGLPYLLPIGVLCALLLAACGQKGPLYLPDDGPAGKQQTK
jgi:predicted small lipoprotein YifL